MNAFFNKLPTIDGLLSRIQDRLVAAFDATQTAFGNIRLGPQMVSFVTLARNGQGTIVLSPLKDNSGNIIRRAIPGMTVVAATSLTSLSDMQGNFERVLSGTDSIKQTSTANLAAEKLLFVMAL